MTGILQSMEGLTAVVAHSDQRELPLKLKDKRKNIEKNNLYQKGISLASLHPWPIKPLRATPLNFLPDVSALERLLFIKETTDSVIVCLQVFLRKRFKTDKWNHYIFGKH